MSNNTPAPAPKDSVPQTTKPSGVLALTKWLISTVGQLYVGLFWPKLGGTLVAGVISALQVVFAIDGGVPWWIAIMYAVITFVFLTWLVLRIFSRRKAQEQPSVAAAPAPQQLTQIATQDVSPVITNSPVFAPQFNLSQAVVQTQERPQPPAPPEPDVEPNLVHLRSYFMPAYLYAGNRVRDGRGLASRGLPSSYAPGPEEVVAIITELRNEAVRGRKVSYVGDVIAHITYTTLEGALLGEVSRAPWLTQEYDHTWFDVGGARRLLIGIITKEERPVALDNYFVSGGHYECVGAYLNAERFYALVRLIAHGEEVGDYKIMVDLTTDPPKCGAVET